MPGIRVDRLLASTAVALLLAASAGGVLADPANATGDKPMSSVPAPPRPPAQHRSARLRRPRPHRQPRRSPTPCRAPRPQRHKSDASGSATANPAPAAASTPPAAAQRLPRLQRPLQPRRSSTPAASSPETAAAPPAAPPGPDAAISDQLRELANGKFDHTISNKKDRMQIDAFYSGRNYKPLWITDGQAQ